MDNFDHIDDMMAFLAKSILKNDEKLEATKGPFFELRNVQVALTNPRSRLSRTETRSTTFSSFGELFWYLSGDNRLDFISYYIKHYEIFSDDGDTITGGYGKRIFNFEGIDQLESIITLLKTKPTSRRAVIQLFHPGDILTKSDGTWAKDVPCTCTLQFFCRGGKLELTSYMRSNDIFYGFPHDVFAFTFIQEIVAARLGLELGSYVHQVGSLHLYLDKIEPIELFISEGFQSHKPMAKMPSDDLEANLRKVQEAETIIRLNSDFESADAIAKSIPPFWSDIIQIFKLFYIHQNYRDFAKSDIIKIADSISSESFDICIQKSLNLFIRKGS